MCRNYVCLKRIFYLFMGQIIIDAALIVNKNSAHKQLLADLWKSGKFLSFTDKFNIVPSSENIKGVSTSQFSLMPN